MPKISVIIPVYNMEKYLSKCLDSVVSQSFDDYEVVVVNDGSTDGSCGILQKYEQLHSPILKVVHQANAGLGAARNTGIDYAKGDYVWFVDSDDWISAEALKLCSLAVIDNDADIVVFQSGLVAENGDSVGSLKGCHCRKRRFTLEEYPQMLIEPPCAWNKLFKKELFTSTNIRFPAGVWYEDLATSGKLYAEADGIAFINEYLYFYLQRKESISHNGFNNKNLEIIDAIEDIIKYYEKKGIIARYKDELEFMSVYHIILMSISRIIRSGGERNLIVALEKYINTRYPNWERNKYIKKMTMPQKLKLFLLRKKLYNVLYVAYYLKR